MRSLPTPPRPRQFPPYRLPGAKADRLQLAPEAVEVVAGVPEVVEVVGELARTEGAEVQVEAALSLNFRLMDDS
jgi:hypothetical protein